MRQDERATSPAARFKQRVKAREPLLGTFVKTPHPAIVEILAQSDLDCICLDAEHAPFDRGVLDLCIMAARAHGLAALVRVASADPHKILSALDLGAAGILVPHVRTREDALAACRAAHYGPGGRGFAGGTRAAGFRPQPISTRLGQAKGETSVILQIEDADALDHIEAIAAIDEVDALFIGRIDLTVSLGEVDPKASTVQESVADITRRAVAAGRTVGMFTPDLAEIPRWRDQGASLFLLGSDQGFLLAGAARLRSDSGLARAEVSD